MRSALSRHPHACMQRLYPRAPVAKETSTMPCLVCKPQHHAKCMRQRITTSSHARTRTALLVQCKLLGVPPSAAQSAESPLLAPHPPIARRTFTLLAALPTTPSWHRKASHDATHRKSLKIPLSGPQGHQRSGLCRLSQKPALARWLRMARAVGS
jgi:hypothetical protein